MEDEKKDHINLVVKRHLTACRNIGVEPQSLETVKREAAEDYELSKRQDGWSVTEPIPESAVITRFTQYESPDKENR
jgi:hypothetical protein